MKKKRPPKDFKASRAIPIYDGTLILWVVSKSSLATVIEKYHDDGKGYCCACTIQSGMRTVLIFCREHLGRGIIAHETNHAVDMIMDRIGCEVSMASREPRAYLQQWMVAWISETLEKKAKIPVDRY